MNQYNMNQHFVTGFVKQAQRKGLSNLHALDILKEAGPLEWLDNKWTNLKDGINTNVNLSNNPISHFLSAATSSSPDGYFGGFGKRMQESQNIDNTQNRAAYNTAAQHQVAQGNLAGVQEHLANAQKYNSYLVDDVKEMEKGTAISTNIANNWNNRQAVMDRNQQAIDTTRNNAYNAATKPFSLAPAGKTLTPPAPPNTQASNSGLLGANSGMPDLRESFTADTNLRKPLGGYK